MNTIPTSRKIADVTVNGTRCQGLFFDGVLHMFAMPVDGRQRVYEVDGDTATFVAALPDYYEAFEALRGAAEAIGRGELLVSEAC